MDTGIKSAIENVATTSVTVVTDYITTFWPVVLSVMFMIGIIGLFKYLAGKAK